MRRVLVTGATGFLGRALVSRLAGDSRFVPRAACRREEQDWPEEVDIVHVGNLNVNTNWDDAVRGIDVVIHAAARTHLRKYEAKNSLKEFRCINVEGALKLAQQAVNANVKRFIFISSIKVNGESTLLGRPFKEDDQPAPEDFYAISKWEAEIGLRRLAEESGMEVVVIRPPLVYGPGVKANFQSMMCWINRGVTLPLGSIHNRRSLVALDNLVDFIITCIEHPGAANQTFLVADGEDLSTTELLRRMGVALGKPARLIPCPVHLLTLLALLLGKRDVAQRLCSSLQIDISKAQEFLGWNPPVSVEQGFRLVAEDFVYGLSTKAK